MGGGLHTGFWWGDMIEREELGLDGTIIIMFFQEVGWGDCVELAKYRDRWRLL
jgi:hypothetical protein